jgi:hypothetical protein
LIERLKARCAASGHPIARGISTHEAGREGFWLARFLTRRGVEVHVMMLPAICEICFRRMGPSVINRREDTTVF